ncbi:MAG: hypothetical protein ACHQHP_04225 [Bacteroidia bacterium]
MKGGVVERGALANNDQGQTGPGVNPSVIDVHADNPSHTEAHEIGHKFLGYKPENNPGATAETAEESIAQHNQAGGIFKVGTLVQGGGAYGQDVIKGTAPVNQNNGDLILQTLPEAQTKEVEQK